MFITCFFCSMAVPKENTTDYCCDRCFPKVLKERAVEKERQRKSQIDALGKLRKKNNQGAFLGDDIEHENWKKDITETDKPIRSESLIGVDDFNCYHPMPKARRA